MKNRMIFLLIVLSLALLSAGNIYAQAPDTLWVGDGQGAPGNVGCIVPITLSNVQDIAGLQFTLTYDPALLVPTGVSLSDRAGAMGTCDWNIPAPGELRVVITDLSGAVIPPGSGPIGEIAFSVDSSVTQRGPTSLTLSNAVLSDAEAVSIPVVTIEGAFTLTDGLTVLGGSGAPGSSDNQVPVSLANAGDIAGVQFTLNYDPTILTPTGVASVGRATGIGTPSWNVPSPGELRALLVNLSGEVIPPGTEPILEIAFNVSPDASAGDTIDLTLAHVVLSDPDARVVNVTPGDGYFAVTEAVAVDTLRVGQGKGVPGSSGNIVPVELVNVEDVAGLQFDLGYDPVRLTPTAVNFVGRASGMGSADWNIPTPGQLRVAISDPGGGVISPGTGSIVEVAFDVADTALIGDIPLPLSEVVLSDTSASSIPVIPIDGLFTVSAGLEVLDSSGESGGSDTVSIEMVNTLDVAGVQFTLNYDSSVLTPTGVSFIGRADSMETSGWNVPASGELRVAISSASGAVIEPGTGPIVQISFDIASVSAQEVPLTLSEVMLADVNAQPIPVIPTDGVFTVIAVAPVADFSASPTSGTAPLTVNFTNLSTGTVTSYAWDFGDGGTSTLENPSHTYSSAGTYTVSLTVTGPAGSDTKTRTNYITVSSPLPPAPVARFTATPTSGVAPLTVQFTDQSTGLVTNWTWDFGDGGTSGQQNPSHTYTTVDTFTVSLTVSGPGGTDTETKSDYIEVRANALPVITSSPDTVAVEDSLYSYDVEATDADGDTLTYSLVVYPEGMSIDPSTGSVTWTPRNDDVGDTTVTVKVSDGRGGEASQSYILTVVNTPPLITSSPDTTALEDSLYTYDVQSDDEGQGGTFYSLLTAPSWLAMVDSAAGLLSGTPTNADVGDTVVTVQVNDGNGGTDTQSWVLTVANIPPQITSSPDTTAWVDSLYTYDVQSDDEGQGSTFYSLLVAPSWLAMVDSTAGLLSGTPTNADVGDTVVTVQVNDGNGGTAEQSYTLHVLAVNHSPVVSPIPDTTAWVGQQFVYQLEAYDPDGDSLSYFDDTELFDINPVTGVIDFTPAAEDTGSYVVVVSVSDGIASDSTSFRLDVRMNHPPVISPVPDLEIRVGEPFSYQIEAYDPDDDSLSYSDDTELFNIDPATGLISFTPAESDTGSYLITVIVSDWQDTSRVSFEWTVVPTRVTITTRKPVGPAGEVVSDPSGAGVDIPAGALPAEVEIEIGQVLNPPPLPEGWRGLATTFYFGPDGIEFAVPVTIRIPYTQEDLDALGVADPEDLSVYVYSVQTGVWEKVTVQAIDQLNMVFIVEVMHFSYFRLTLANRPPVVASIPDTTLSRDRMGQLYTYQVQASDPDGDPLTYALLESPSRMTIDSQGLIQWRPLSEDEGQWTVRVQVSDPDTSVEISYSLTVEGFGVEVTARQAIGPDGGAFTSPESLAVEIPPGALTDTVTISLGVVTIQPPDFPTDEATPLGRIYYVGPDGQTFADTLAATVCIPYAQALAQAEPGVGVNDLRAYAYDIFGQKWGAVTRAQADTVTKMIRIRAGSFFYFQLALRKVSVEMSETGPSLPGSFALYQNYPNPFNQRTVICYQVPERSLVRLSIYNISGQLVKTLVREEKAAGYYSVQWDGRDSFGKPVASGVYLYRLQAKGFSCTKRLVILK